MDIEAEQALLGILLARPESLADIPWFRAPYLSDQLHQQIFLGLQDFVAAGERVDAAKLKSWADTLEPIDDRLNVWGYMGRMMAYSPAGFRPDGYAEAVRDYWLRRQLMGLTQDVQQGLAEKYQPKDIVRHLQDLVYDLSDVNGHHRSRVSMVDAVERALEGINEARTNGGLIRGVRTGFADLDREIGGLNNSDLVVLAGRPSMGKTALAMGIATHAAKDGKRVLFFSQEMSAEQLALRMIADEADLNGSKLRRGNFEDHEYRQAWEAGHRLRGLPIEFEETGGITVSQIAVAARRKKIKGGLDLIVIDYLQLLGSDRRTENRTQELTDQTKGLKALAKSLDVPILLLSQLSRKVEERADKRPQLSDLRESGSIEQDADVVMFVFREEYYVLRTKPDISDPNYADYQKRLMKCSGIAEAILGKHRHGQVGTIKLAFNADRTRFSDLARGGRDAEAR